jgi:hypothetical protein
VVAGAATRTVTFCPGLKCVDCVCSPNMEWPSPQLGSVTVITGLRTHTGPFPMQPNQMAIPVRAEMVKVLGPVPVTGPRIVT